MVFLQGVTHDGTPYTKVYCGVTETCTEIYWSHGIYDVWCVNPLNGRRTVIKAKVRLY